MCHHYHIRLPAGDEKDVRKLSGLMIPLYASIVLVVIVMVAVTGTAPQGQMVASTSVPAPAR